MLPLLLATIFMLIPAGDDSIVEEALAVTREHFYDADVLEQAWARVEVQSLPRSEATTVINHFLGLLNTSHTAHYTPRQQAYYELLDIYSAAGLGEAVGRLFPEGVFYCGIEAHYAELDGGTFITAIWPGGPADAAGLKVGDEVLNADGKAFDPIASFEGKEGATVSLLIRRHRGGQGVEVLVRPKRIFPSDALERAMRESVEVVNVDGAELGAIRPWSYGGQRYHAVLVDELTRGRLRDVDGLILDLRGGWGGASPEFAELFVGGRPNMMLRARNGQEHVVSFRWRKPVVVLIDHGTRSGKEVLAHTFRNAGIDLIGSTTAGAVVGGRPFLLSDGSLLIVASMDVVVDGRRLEGVGVKPTVPVPFDLRYAAGADPQRDAALKVLRAQVSEAAKRLDGEKSR